MNSYIVSIRPKWVEKIASREKPIEARKSAPKEVPFKAYIYETKESKKRYLDDRFNSFFNNKSHYTDMGKIIGEFICDKVEKFYCASVPYQKKNNLGYGQFVDNGVYKVNGWHEGVVFERNDRYIDTMLNNNDLKEMCLSAQELFDYIGIGKYLYAWHISDLKIYDKPKELSEFTRPCSYDGICFSCKRFIANGMPYGFCDSTITRPPQSYMRVEELKEV